MKEIRENIKKTYEESKRIIKKAQKEQQLVLFVGAGASIDSGIPSWETAINMIADRLDIEKKERIDTLRIPQFYYNSRGKKEYTQLMRQIFRSGEDLDLNPIHKELIKINAGTIVTTNYDKLIEKAAEENAEVLDVVSCNEDLPYRKGGKELLKIHGDFEHDNFVLKEDDYLAYSRNFRLIENYVKSLIGTKVLLIVGYSFNDPDIKQIFDWAKDVLKSDFQRAYLIEIKNEYDPNEETYYRNFGINVLYASIMLNDFAALKYSERLVKMISWINENEELSTIDKIYSELRPFSFLKYTYGKYVTNTFRNLGFYCDNGQISYMKKTSSYQPADALNRIAYNIAKRNKKKCYVFADNNRKIEISIPEKYKSEDNEKINTIIEILEKSSINRLELAIPVDSDMPLVEGEQEIFGAHRVIVEIDNIEPPEWIDAINCFDYYKLQKIEEHNDERLSEESIELYMEQAQIAFFRKRYLKSYNLLKTYLKVQYKKHNYAEYFFAETCRKYIGQFIISHNVILGISVKDRDSVDKELKSIDLDRTFRSLPDLGGENKVFKDLYTFNIAHSLFQESYACSQKVKEQAQTTYSFFAGTPAFSLLRQTVMDFYYFELFNSVGLDEYRENRDIFKLYFTNMLLSVSTPDSGGDCDERPVDSVFSSGNIHADMLSGFDIYIATRYISVKELKNILNTLKSNLIFSEEIQQYIISIIYNLGDEPIVFGSERLIWRILCIVSYSELSKEMVEAVLKVLNLHVKSEEYGNYRYIINKLLINIENQGLYDEENIKLLADILEKEIQYLIKDINQISLHELLLINVTYFCYKYKHPYGKISHFKKLINRETEIVCLQCYSYFDVKIKRYLSDIYRNWKCDRGYHDLQVYCLLVGSGIIEADEKMEHEIYKYCENDEKNTPGVIVVGDGKDRICSCIVELYLQKKIVDIDSFKVFIEGSGIDYYRWLINPSDFDYCLFKIEWLKKCSRGLLESIVQDKKVKRQISNMMITEYNKNGLGDEMLSIFFRHLV